jgi:hypothetical protein
VLFSSNQEELKQQMDTGNPDEWMTAAPQIATGSRRQVVENGPDVMNSDNDSDDEQHGDEILDGYLGIKTDAHGNPIGKEHHMETSQADQMRREAKASRAGGLRSGVGPGKMDKCVTKGHPS